MASDTTKTIKEESEARRRQKERDGVLSSLSGPDQQEMGSKTQNLANRVSALMGSDPDRLKRIKDTRLHTTGDPYRRFRTPEGEEWRTRVKEDRLGANIGTPEYGRAFATEYAERRGFDKPPGEVEDLVPGSPEAQAFSEDLDAREAALRRSEAEVAEEIEVETTPAVEEPAYKQTARRLAADLKKDGTTTESWEAAKQEVADRGARYRDALQSPDAWKRDIDAKRMAEVGEVGDVVGAKDSGFEEEYDATTKFQEEEYKSPSGGGSIERDRMLAEIMGQEHQTAPDPGGVEGTITDPDLYEQYYHDAKEKNPWAQKEDLQDAAIKGVMAEQAERAALEAEKFPEPLEAEATETVGGGLGYEKTIEELRQEKADREAAAKKATPALSDDAKKRLKAGGAGTPRQLTDAERVAKKVLAASPGRPGVMAAIEKNRLAREARQQEADEYFAPAPAPDAGLQELLKLQKEDPESFAKMQSIPGMEDIVPAIRALNSEGTDGTPQSEGLLSFNRAFAKRPPPGFGESQVRKQDYRPEAIAAMPEALREGLQATLSEALKRREASTSDRIEVVVGEALRKLLKQQYEEVGANVPLGPEEEAMIKDRASVIAKQLVKTEDISAPLRWVGQEGREIGSTQFGGEDPILDFGQRLYHDFGSRWVKPGAPEGALSGAGEASGEVLDWLRSLVPEEDRQAIVALREGERTLGMLSAEPSAAPEEGGVTDTEVTKEMVDAGYTGQGTQTWASGSTYEGGFKDGKRTGQGTYTWANGNTYEGDFKDGKRTGQGTYTWPNGGIYEGDWKDGKRAGQGTYTWADGNTYEGDFKDGKRTGQGTYTWADGTTYVGDFKDGEMTGQGTKTNPDGTIVETGQWENDTLLDAEEDIADGIEGEMDTP